MKYGYLLVLIQKKANNDEKKSHFRGPFEYHCLHETLLYNIYQVSFDAFIVQFFFAFNLRHNNVLLSDHT